MKRKREIFVDLTSLLDVILILFFLVLSQSGMQAANAESDAAKATEKTEQMAQELQLANDALAKKEREEITRSLVEENSFIITISIEQGRTNRVLIEPQNADSYYITISENSPNTTSDRLTDELARRYLASPLDSAFLVFQYDNDAIYQRDYKMVQQAIQNLKLRLREEGRMFTVIEQNNNGQ